MNALKESIRTLVSTLGYNIRNTASIGVCPFSDMKRFVPTNPNPLILDIGANVGQSVERFKKIFPSSTIHSFEPSPETFRKLSQNVSTQKNVVIWNCGIGASICRQEFLENTSSVRSSFLGWSTTSWGQVKTKTVVDITTIDHFLEAHHIGYVNILKSDTQGYDFEVFKGAERTMRENRIGLLYFEFIFSDMYKNLPSFDEVFRYLIDRNFSLVSIYNIHHQKRLAIEADLLFVNREYYAKVT